MNAPPAPIAERHFSEDECRLRLAYLDFGERDAELLRELEAVFLPHMDSIAEGFYQHLLGFEATRDVLKDEAAVRRLKETQKDYLRQSLHGPYDPAYFERRWRIGHIHHVIRLDPKWFVGAFQLYHRLLFPLILAHDRDDAQALAQHILALDKIMTIDMTVGLESYWSYYIETMREISHLNGRLKQASEAKNQFLANMSHEFRTPLNAILGFTEVLQDNIAGPLNDEQREYLGDIHNAGRLLLRLINDALDIAKVEAGHLELFYETFPVARAVRDAVTTLTSAADEKGLWIRLDFDPNLGVITADQIRFKQILYNLLSNAVKFTDHGGIALRAQVEDGAVHLSVKDTGIGIRPDDIPKIFQQFSRLESGQGRPHEGSGLGLALTKNLVEAHGGRIWLDSRWQEGSIFHVVLPLAPPEKATAPQQGIRP
ncbi:MAG: HAMP domain-containing sensor histidine kinase [Betaproteobacteria bacterium]|nr:HAMP domain-containing sensor histidine kinase [Betaproteobacteria bacterium]